MKKPILLLLLCTFLWSCDEYEVVDNSRLIFSGKIMDQEGNPIPNVYVFLEGRDQVATGFPAKSSRSHILGKDWTDANGQYDITSLESTRNYLHINPSEDYFFLQLS